MAVGQLDKHKVGCIIQARMKSARLPGKVLLPLPFPNGETLLGLIVNQLRTIFKHEHIIVATSKNEENDVLVEYCSTHDIKFYRGSEVNVLSRFTDLQRQNDFEHIFRFTADNPIVDPSILCDFFDWHCNKDNDYSNTLGLPLGMNMEVFKGTALLESLEFAKSEFDKEHVTPALKRESFFSRKAYEFNSDFKDIRLTIDTPTDFTVLSSLLLYAREKNLKGLSIVKDIIKKYPWLLEGNQSIFQKNRFTSTSEELREAVDVLKKLEYFEAAKVLVGK